MSRQVTLGAMIALVLAAPSAGAQEMTSDYPTIARAEYVMACMATNGQTRQALERCSCSVDVIASILPHTRYEQAETILRMLQVSGQSAELFRATPELRDTVADLRRAQAEAEIACFP